MGVPTATIPYNAASLPQIYSVDGEYFLAVQNGPTIANMAFIQIDDYMKDRAHYSFDTSEPSESTTKGYLQWSVSLDALTLIEDGAVTVIGRSLMKRVFASGSITKGYLLARTGNVVSDVLEVRHATAADEAEDIVGIAYGDIADDTIGFAVEKGTVSGVNTNAWTVGTVLYPHASTDGWYSEDQAEAPALRIPVGSVEKRGVSDGKIMVKLGSAPSLNKLHDVHIDDMLHRDILVWDVYNQRYYNSPVIKDLEAEIESVRNLYAEPPIKRAFLYYDYPSNIATGQPNPLEFASEYIAGYDQFISGPDGWEGGEGSWIEELEYVYPRVRELNPRIETYGYVATGHYQSVDHSYIGSTMEEIYSNIDQYVSRLQVTGIFLDEFGYDYYDATHYQSRERNNAIIDYCHSLGLNVMVNGWYEDQKFGVDPADDFNYHPDADLPTVVSGPNPNGLISSLNEHDYHMFENRLCYGNDASMTYRAGDVVKKIPEYFMKEQTGTPYEMVDGSPVALTPFNGDSYYQYYGTKVISLNSVQDTAIGRAVQRDVAYMNILFGCHSMETAINTSPGQYSGTRVFDGNPVPTSRFFNGNPDHAIAYDEATSSPTDFAAWCGSIYLEARWDPPYNSYVDYNGTRVTALLQPDFHGFMSKLNQSRMVTVESDSYTVLSYNAIIKVNQTIAEEVDIYLPPLSKASDELLVIKDNGGNASNNPITLHGDDTDLIDGSATKQINVDYGAVVLWNDGTQWMSILGSAGTSEMQDYVSSTVKTWILAGSYTISEASYDDDYNIESGTVVFPDESEGEISDVVTDEYGISSITFTRNTVAYTMNIYRDSNGMVESTEFV